MKNYEVVATYRYKERTCVIVKMNNSPLLGVLTMILEGDSPFARESHNGYVQVSPQKVPCEDDLTSETITFAGELEVDKPELAGLYFVGFDTCHASDTAITQSANAVKERLDAFAEELIAKGF